MGETRRRRSALGLLLVGALLLSGCAGSRIALERKAAAQADRGNDGAMIQQLRLPAESDASVNGLVNYNPYAPKQLTRSWIYEPLMIQNGSTCEITPWLATGYRWDANNLTFTIRQGVKWSDGQDLTPADVAFTLNLMKKYPAIDKAGIWNETYGAPATEVTVAGNDVTIHFSGPAATKFPGMVLNNAVVILPEHVYGKAGDPATFVDKTPVGTGPFTVGSYNGRRLELERNPTYWQADKVKVQKLVLEGTYDAQQAASKLAAGELDAYFGEIPNPEKTFVEKDPANNHFWYGAAGSTVLTMNLMQKPFDDVKFRQAVSLAMDKQQMSLKATYGIMAPASQSGLRLPVVKDMLPAQYAAADGAQTVLPYDPGQGNQILDAAGYAKGADGFRTNTDGSPLAVNFSVQAGYIDYQATADVVVAGLKALGLNASVTQSSPDAVDQQKKSGEFQILFEYLAGGCDFVRGLGSKIDTTQIPKPDTVLSNVERFSDPAVDKTLSDLGVVTNDGQRKALVGKLVDVMMTQYPVTPLIYAPARIVYSTRNAVGWPNAEDPYAFADSDRLIVLTHLSGS
ncbi:MAG: ABC transporter substrate-binding protein [Nakamurella sp.]